MTDLKEPIYGYQWRCVPGCDFANHELRQRCRNCGTPRSLAAFIDYYRPAVFFVADLIARLEALEKQATPGPWKYVLDGQGWPLLTAGDDVIFSPQGANNEPRPDADSAFAIELRNNLPAIIRALKVQQAAEAWVSAAESFEPIGRGPTNLRLAGDALVRAVKGEQP